MRVALDVNLLLDRTPAAGLPWRGLIVFGAPCMANSGVLGKILAASPGDGEFGAISYIRNGNKRPGVVSAQHANNSSPKVSSFSISASMISLVSTGSS